jgi:hypothetical protein
MDHLKDSLMTPEQLAAWVKDRQAGVQFEAQKKIYAQPKIGYATYHWLWLLGHPDGVEKNFNKSDIKEVDLLRRADGTWSWR